MATQRFFLRGEIDLASSLQLQCDLDGLVSTSDEDIVLDCCGLTFIDSSGIAVIVRTQKALNKRGNELRITNIDGIAARVLDVLGLTEALHVNEPGTRLTR